MPTTPRAASPSPEPKEPGAFAFVWGLWLILVVADLGFVMRFGSQVLTIDDYAIVPALTGRQPLTPSWLWSLHNEHRIPLSRLVILAADRLSGNDFRAAMICTVLSLAVGSAALIVAAGNIRKGTSYADAMFPLILLNWGHEDNLLWNFQVVFGMSTMFVCLAAALILRRREGPGRWGLLGLGTLLAVQPLNGACGMALAPGLGGWLLLLAISRAISGRPRPALAALAAALPGLALAAFYFVDYHGRSRSAGPRTRVRSSGRPCNAWPSPWDRSRPGSGGSSPRRPSACSCSGWPRCCSSRCEGPASGCGPSACWP